MHFIHEEIGVPTLKMEEIGVNDVAFTLSPLPQGYGTTIGNSLRRVLLSSLPGSAVTGIKVKGITHEYTSIPGVKETVLDILLNFKLLRVRKTSSEPSVLKLSVSGEKVVTADMIESSSDVEILNTDLVLDTLTEKKATLDVEIRVEKGVGYMPIAELRAREQDPHMILVDASFSPVIHVRYDVSATRVGQNTNLDKLVVQVRTDGSITPKDALIFSTNTLGSYLALFNKDNVVVEPGFVADADRIIAKQRSAESEQRESYTPIEVLGLSPRTLNALINGNIGSIEQLVKCTESKLGNLRGFGKKAMTEIKSALKERDLKLLGDE